MWTGRPPKIAHLKPFGCVGYVHTNQGKLDSRAMKAIFLGYPKGVKGYRLWLINDRKVVISRDVIFNEKVFFKTNLQVPEPTKNADNFQFEVENGKLNKAPGGNDTDLQVEDLEDDQLREDIGVTSPIFGRQL